ncbi:hypothetical protein HOU03_gp312 [Caulobacter phage CcrSC]|uniref:Uncharacterized protein n=1 Tax=Caulobacter phage CcrSC TaxID=2283272 RepID=A0A385EE57_9CAUD|nr:hypothetical protein HOU03_gp312 [Caulobacter phage CcrSC]AXQ69956.1 hypothetical protein CcrSC_gp374 [Caulobacter phage CcrSC]
MALLQHYQIGQQVRVRLLAEEPWTQDWQDYADLWVAGVEYEIGKGTPSYTLADHWPPRTRGDMTSEFSEHHIEAV